MSIKKKKTSPTHVSSVHASAYLEKLLGGPLTFAQLLSSIRKGEDWSQNEMAKRLKVTRSFICNLEKGRKIPSLQSAVDYAEALGYSPHQFATLVIQDQVNKMGFPAKVSIADAG